MGTTTYEFRIDGQLSEQAREAFCDMRIDQQAERATLYGEVIDESHLLGILAQFGVLRLAVLSAHRVASGAGPLPQSHVPGTAEFRRPAPRGRSADSCVVDDGVDGCVNDGG